MQSWVSHNWWWLLTAAGVVAWAIVRFRFFPHKRPANMSAAQYRLYFVLFAVSVISSALGR
jgi:hypothetical protein